MIRPTSGDNLKWTSSTLYGLSFWDAAIIAAAEAGRCKRILSEDVNTGQFYCGIQMVNPLAAPAVSL